MAAEQAASEAGADDSQETPGDDLEGESGAGNDEEVAEDPDDDTEPGEEDGPGDGQQAGDAAPATPEVEAAPQEVDLANVDPDTIEPPKPEEFDAAVVEWQHNMAAVDREVDSRVGQRVSALRTAEKNVDAAIKNLEDSLFDEELGKQRPPTLAEIDRRNELREHKAHVRTKIADLENTGAELKQSAKNELTIASMAKADKRFQHPGIAKAHRAAVEEGLRFKDANHLYRYCKASFDAENGGKPLVKPDVAGARRAAEEAAIKRKAAGTIGAQSKGSSNKSKAATGGKSSDPPWVQRTTARTAQLKKEFAKG